MNSDNPLCCCEYFDVQHERNHILACCCNCQHLDQGFDSFISGHGIPRENQAGLMTTLQDRCRIPWRGGARQLSIDTVLPIIFIPTFLIIASKSPFWTIFSGCTMIVFLLYIRYTINQNFPKSKFFYAWTVISFLVLYLVFEFVIITFLEILWEENIALTFVISFSMICFYKVKSNKARGNGERNCNICQAQVPAYSEHILWLDCCITPMNVRLYILGLISTFIALVYGANLTLTSICHPYTIFGNILIPDDCSDAYDLFEIGLSFVSALYSLAGATFIFLLLLRRGISLMLICMCKNWGYNNRKGYSSVLI